MTLPPIDSFGEVIRLNDSVIAQTISGLKLGTVVEMQTIETTGNVRRIIGLHIAGHGRITKMQDNGRQFDSIVLLNFNAQVVGCSKTESL